MHAHVWLSFSLSCLALTACEAAALSTRDAQSGLDAGAETDASSLDASSLDGSASITDASGARDASWGSCSYAGVMGTCEPTADCPAGSMPMPGLCPGPADIQCCLPITDGATPAITADEARARLGACTRIGGDYATDAGGVENIPICQTDDVIWWTADMDIDCDGGRSATCMSDPDYLPETSAADSMGQPLDASTLPFIVIPLASARFRYSDHGIRAGQVALVLYGDRMVFGIFGDAGPSSSIGEASFAMAEALGIPSNPRTGGVDSGVTYLVFTGASARVTRNEDHDEAVSLGTTLLDAFVR